MARLSLFALFSLALHGALLLSPPRVVPNGVSHPPLQLTLMELEKAAAPTRAHTALLAKPPHTPRVTATSADNTALPINTSSAMSASGAATPATIPSATQITGNDIAALQASLQHELAQALAEHFSYPLLARKRGWQGEVHLAFTLDNQGTIVQARIAQSSGYSALDGAALQSLRQVAGIGRPLQQEFNLELPVVYRLNGG